jgi:ribonuclease P protein component
VNNFYEATISAVKNPPQTAAWVLEPQLEEERPRDPCQPPPGGTQAPDAGLIAFAMAPRGPRLSLGRTCRIKSGRDFAQIKREGCRTVLGCMIANWQPCQPESRSRLGVITSGKIGGAVIRNRARRLLREAFRAHQHELSQPIDLILIARHSISGKRMSEVEKDLLSVLRKAKLLK